MRCEDILPLLYDHIDGDLTDGDRAPLEAHLAECPAFRAQLESIKRADLFYKHEIIVEPSKGMEERIAAAMLKESASTNVKTFPARARYAAVIAAAASVFAAAFYFLGLLPESGLVIERVYDLGASIDPKQWPERLTESIRAISEIGFADLGNRIIDATVDAFKAIAGAVPAPQKYMIAVVVAVAALQVVFSYRLLESDRQLNRTQED